MNQVAGVAGSFLGLIIGGLLSQWHWRAVFWVSVPVGIWGTWMGYRTLHDKPRLNTKKVVIDWWGNITFGVGLTGILVGITYGLQPWRSHHGLDLAPRSIRADRRCAATDSFCIIENPVDDPMINMRCSKFGPSLQARR